MKPAKHLTIKSLLGKPVRTVVLMLLTALLGLTVFGGSMTVSSLRSGLGSLESRLGADVMVVPYSAATQKKFEDIILQGSTGYFYMDKKYMNEIAELESVGDISAQFYLASASSVLMMW